MEFGTRPQEKMMKEQEDKAAEPYVEINLFFDEFIPGAWRVFETDAIGTNIVKIKIPIPKEILERNK